MRSFLLSVITVFALTLTACDVNEGGAEEAGENIDEMMTDTGNKVEDLCEDAKQSMNTEDEDC